MKMQIFNFLFLLAITCNNSDKESVEYTILKNCNIITMQTDTLLKGKNIVLKDDRIVEIGDKIDSRFLTSESKIVNCSGKFVIPGLFDSHFHYGRNKDLYVISDSLLLTFGITNVFSFHGSEELMTYRKKNIIDKRPHLLSTGRNQNNSLTKKEVLKNLKGHRRNGFNFIKVYTNLPEQTFLFFDRMAPKENLRLVGHIPRDIGFFNLMQSNQELIVHAEEFLYNEPINYLMGIDKVAEPDYELIDTIAATLHKYGKSVSPTLVSFRSILSQSKNQNLQSGVEYNPPLNKIADYWNWYPPNNTIPEKFNTKGKIYRLEKGLKFQELLVKSLYDHEVKMLAGTDSPAYWNLVPGESLHQELELISQCGIPEYDVLKMATINPASFLGISNDFGTVEVGKIANLLILNENPLQDISNTTNIYKVILNGKILDKTEK